MAFHVVLFTLFLSLIYSPSAAWADYKILEEQANGFGVSVLAETYSSINAGGKMYEGVIVKGLEHVRPTDYRDGVPLAVLRYGSQSLGIPDGIYLLKAKSGAPLKSAGRQSVELQLVRRDMTEAYRSPSFTMVSDPIQLNSSSLPTIEFRTLAGDDALNGRTPSEAGVMAIVCCPGNGMCGECIGPACPK